MNKWAGSSADELNCYFKLYGCLIEFVPHYNINERFKDSDEQESK